MSGFLIFLGILLLLAGAASIGVPLVKPDLEFLSSTVAGQSLSSLAPLVGSAGAGLGLVLIIIGALTGRRPREAGPIRSPRMADAAPARPYLVPDILGRKKADPAKTERKVSADAIFASAQSGKPPPEPVSLTEGDMLDAIALNVGDSVVQHFETRTRFTCIDVSFLAWNQTPSEYSIHWALKNEQGITLSSGRLQAAQLTDWQKVPIPARGGPGKFSLHIFSPLRPEPAANPVGLVVATLASPGTPFAMKNGDPLAIPGGLQMWIHGE